MTRVKGKIDETDGLYLHVEAPAAACQHEGPLGRQFAPCLDNIFDAEAVSAMSTVYVELLQRAVIAPRMLYSDRIE